MVRSILLIVALLVSSAPLRAEVIHIDSAALPQLMMDGVPVIDVRTPGEWDKTGVIEGSHLLTFFDAQGRYDLASWMSKLRPIAATDQPVAILCHSGRRSNSVSRFLHDKMGYRQVYNLRGGIAAWTAEKRPTVLRR